MQDEAASMPMDPTVLQEGVEVSDAPLPLPYVEDEGLKKPLPGVQSVFLTSKFAPCTAR